MWCAVVSEAFLTLDAAAGICLALLAAEEGVPEALALFDEPGALFGRLAALRRDTDGTSAQEATFITVAGGGVWKHRSSAIAVLTWLPAACRVQALDRLSCAHLHAVAVDQTLHELL